MMPRKRSTKTPASRPKPVLPDGDEGHNLSAEDKRLKKETFLKDFDNECKIKLEQLRRSAAKMVELINQAYTLELMKLPQEHRKMKRVDFLKVGGIIDQSKMLEADLALDNIIQDAIGHGGKSRFKHETIMEEEDAENQKKSRKEVDVTASVRALRQRIMTPTMVSPNGCVTRGRVGKALGSSMQPPPAPTATRPRRNTAKSAYKTPAYKGLPASAFGFDTPAITPKFDPRLPITPGGVRDAKPGERLMSLAGSPVANSKRGLGKPTPQVTVPLANGNSITLSTASEVSQVPPLDDQTRANILLLQEKLAAILTVPPAK